jgi:RNA polymerase sigma factor (sigma-70 family)
VKNSSFLIEWPQLITFFEGEFIAFPATGEYRTVKDLFEEHIPSVYRFAFRLTGDWNDAEELAQAALLAAWEGRTRLRDSRVVKGWLFSIAANLWRSGHRRKICEAAFRNEYELSGFSKEQLPEQKIIAGEDLSRVLKAMDALPDRQREVLHLHACESFSLSEIAEILAVTPEAVKSSLSLARKRMREQLKDLNN